MEKNSNTLTFIQLVKCIIEYYGTTKSENDAESVEEKRELDDAEKLLSEIQDFNLEQMSINIPEEIDKEVKNTFLFELRKYRDEIKESNKE